MLVLCRFEPRRRRGGQNLVTRCMRSQDMHVRKVSLLQLVSELAAAVVVELGHLVQ